MNAKNRLRRIEQAFPPSKHFADLDRLRRLPVATLTDDELIALINADLGRRLDSPITDEELARIAKGNQ